MTIRLVDERLSASGVTPEHRDVIRLARAAGLRHPEALVWPGGLRVVFSEESLSAAAGATAAEGGVAAADGSAGGPSDAPSGCTCQRPPPSEAEVVRQAQVNKLSAQLSELHGQQMAFFLALLDARLGFDTAASASVQRQADRERLPSQVPPALPQGGMGLMPLQHAAMQARQQHLQPPYAAVPSLGYPLNPQTPSVSGGYFDAPLPAPRRPRLAFVG